MNLVGIYIAIGVAFVFATIFFYYTYKNIRTYHDREVDDINREQRPS